MLLIISYNTRMKKIPANYITPEALELLKNVVAENHPDLYLAYELLTCCGNQFEGRPKPGEEDENGYDMCSHIVISINRGKPDYFGNGYREDEPISEEEFLSVLAEAGLSFDLDAENMEDETDEDSYNYDVVEYGTDAPYYYYDSETHRWLNVVFKLLEDTYNI